ncbi:cytochrome P450 [Salix suchowensis]|nr:cytochrome P450 [Salix suchowensis]
MPKEKEWLTFAKWGEMWGSSIFITHTSGLFLTVVGDTGDLVTIKIFGQPFIILNNINVAAELLDERSAINSDRPVVPMGGELVGWKNTLVLIPYGARFRSFRKKFHQVIGTPAMMKQFEPTEEHETQKFLRRLLKSPEDLGAHVRKMAGAIILQISHGYTVMEGTDPLSHWPTKPRSNSHTLRRRAVSCCISAGLVPGTGFKQTAKEWAKTLDETVSYPFRFVKEQMASGTAEKSFVSALLEEPVTPEEENDIKWSAASLYTDRCIELRVLPSDDPVPEVQKKAQAELDAVVGPNRLPTFQDRPNLPYMNAVALEALRWHSVAPTCRSPLCLLLDLLADTVLQPSPPDNRGSILQGLLHPERDTLSHKHLVNIHLP